MRLGDGVSGIFFGSARKRLSFCAANFRLLWNGQSASALFFSIVPLSRTSTDSLTHNSLFRLLCEYTLWCSYHHHHRFIPSYASSKGFYQAKVDPN
jgi:hypothetical protein